MTLRSVATDQAFLNEVGEAIEGILENWKDRIPPTSVIALLVDLTHGHCLVVSDLATGSILHALEAAHAAVACTPMPANEEAPQ
jgi:hypothetical protein